MAATSGYFIAGSSWLHRRHPLTKLLGVALVLLSASCCRRSSCPLLGLGLFALAGRVRAARCRSCARCASRPSCSARSWSSTRCSSRAATDRLARARPAGGHARGPDLRAHLRRSLPGRLPGPVLFLFTTLADDLLEALISRGVSHRLAFVVLSAVQLVPRMQARAGSILEAQQARGLSIERVVRAPPAGARAARRPGPARRRSSTCASGRSRSRHAGSVPGRPGRPTASWPTRR